MNRTYRVIWSEARRAWVVTCELATRHGKSSRGVDVDRRVIPRGPAHSSQRALGLLAALLTLHAPTWAADRYWDPNATSSGRGGTGTWNTTSGFWSNNADGVSGPYSPWNNAALDDAIFGDAATATGFTGTVTLGTAITVHNMTFEDDTLAPFVETSYTFTGNTLTLGGTTPTITVNGNANDRVTIDSVIAGTAGLIKAGGGILTLNGANTFSGDLRITGGGTLSVNGNAALGAAANGVIVDAIDSTDSNALNKFISTGALDATRTLTLSGTGYTSLGGAGVGSARITGTGGILLDAGTLTLSNPLNDFTGKVRIATPTYGNATLSFNSIADLGVASSLGAATGANGTIDLFAGAVTLTEAIYTGAAASSNRPWDIRDSTFATARLTNSGTGTLRLTGNVALGTSSAGALTFNAQTADLRFDGVISGAGNGALTLAGSSTNRNIVLNGANTYANSTRIEGVTVQANSLADTGTASSFGSATNLGTNAALSLTSGVLSYTGAGSSTNRSWLFNGNNSVRNDGSGALTLSGPLTFQAGGAVENLTLGGSYTGTNTLSGLISGTGNLIMNGSGTWEISGANTYTGGVTVTNGMLRVGSGLAFGLPNTLTVNGGVLDLNGIGTAFTSLTGSGGSIATSGATLFVNGTSASTPAYAGSITGSGGLSKLGPGTLTLTGSNTYSGVTNVGGGVLNLDFSGTPISNIISSTSTLVMSGGTLNVTGATGETNIQTFNGLNVTRGNNRIIATSGGSGASVTVNLGALTHTGGLMDFTLPGSGAIRTTNPNGALSWATVNARDYAVVTGGDITAFTAYVNKDDASTWANGDVLSDANGLANSPFFNTVSSDIQLGGWRYTAAANSTVTVDDVNTLGVDGVIIVASDVGSADQTIEGGSLRGSASGSLSVLQYGAGNFTISSTIVDNGGATDFTKAGSGLVTLNNDDNSYSGVTTISGGTLSIASIGNGGVASSIGQSTADSANLVLENGTLRYTGGTATTDRGFSLANGGPARAIDVSNGTTNLTFAGLVTSADDGSLSKTGAGTLTLANDANDYIGGTAIYGGALSVDTLADVGSVSGIGRGALLIDGATAALEYTGATTSIDRGFALGNNGGSIDVDNAGTTLTLSGTALGAGGLRKEGSGTLVLTGTNTYTGGTTVNAGTLRAGSLQAFGSLTSIMTVNTGGTLDLGGIPLQMGALHGGGNVNLGSVALTIDGNNSSAPGFTGTISGTGGLIKRAGTQVISGCNNTYTGTTTIEGGVLSVDCLADGGQASAIGRSSSAASNLSVGIWGVFNYTGASVTTDRGFTLASCCGGASFLAVTEAATDLEFTGQVAGGDWFIKTGPGTLVLSGANTYVGTTQVQQGILRAGSSSAFGSSGVRLEQAGTLDLNGFSNTIAWLLDGDNNAATPAGNVLLSGGATLTIGSGHGGGPEYNFPGVISGNGNLVKSGGSIQRLTGCNNSYTGITAITGGILEVSCLANGGSNSALGAAGTAAEQLILNGGTLAYVGAGSSTDRLFTLGPSPTSVLESSGTGPVSFTNIGAIEFTGTNTSQTVTLTGTNAGDNSLAARIANNGSGTTSLTKSGSGTWILRNPGSTYMGATTISAGVLGVDKLANGGAPSSIGMSSAAASNLVIGSGSTLRYTGAGDTTDRLFTLSTGSSSIESSGTGPITFSNTGAAEYVGSGNRTLAVGGTNAGLNTMGGTIINGPGGTTTLAKNGPGTWVLTGNNTYTGSTVINDGNLMVGNGGTTGNAGAGNVIVDSPTSTLSINRSDAFDFTGTLSGPGTLAQIGTGTSRLTSASNAIGATTISAGTLEVDGGLTTASLAMTGASRLDVDGTVQAQTTTVGTDATLHVDGTYTGTAGNDTFTVAGTVGGIGNISLGTGDDVLTLLDDAAMSIAIDAGGAATGDRVVLDSASALSFGNNVSGFETLVKQNTGAATLTGTHDYADTQIGSGTLDVDGTLNTATVALGDGATLNVDGTVQAAGTLQTAITGTAGANTVAVSEGASLLATGNLGDGNDVLDLAGTLDTGGGTFFLGAGNDTFVVHNTTTVIGSLDAGTGDDMLNVNIDSGSIVQLGSTTAFESLGKSGLGELEINGASDFVDVQVQAGLLDVTAGGSIQVQTATVSDGATLNVDGAFTFTPGSNTFTVGGTVASAGGPIEMLDGDDVLVLQDDAQLNVAVDAGAAVTRDTVVLDTASTFTLSAANIVGFERLMKRNAGTATITGNQSFAAGVAIDGGVLDVDGTLETGAITLADGATLLVDDTVQAAGATQTTITGSAGANSVQVSAGATALAIGDLGDGADVLDVGGTLEVGAGNFLLGAGDDSFVIHDATVVNGTIVGGAGLDTRVYDIAGTATVGALQEFEGLTKRNTGTLTLSGPGATTALIEVAVEGGILNLAAGASVAGVSTATVDAGAILNVAGDLGFTAAGDSFTVAGTVTGPGSIDMLDGDDRLTIFDGADLSGLTTSLEGGTGVDTLTADISTTAILGNASGFEMLIKEGVGSATIAAPASSVFDTVLVQEGTLRVAVGAVVDPTTTAIDAPATLMVDGIYYGTADADTFTLSGTLAGAGTIDLLDGDDTLTINAGADVTFSGLVDASTASADRFVLAGADVDSFDASLIGTVFQNFDFFDKQGGGTWRLTGTGNQNWTVSDGILIGDSTSLSGNIANDATVIFDQASDGTYAGAMSGSGLLLKQSSGTLAMIGNNTFSGNARVAEGTLQVDGTLPAAMMVASGATLSGIGTVSDVATQTGGFVRPGNPADPFGTLTIAGNYTGSGTVSIDTVLGDERSATSRLVIQGGTTGADSRVVVNRMGGSGAQTSGDGIEVIQVDGASPADSFGLAQPVEAGAYEYLLYQGGAADANDWYLRSELIDAQEPVDPDAPTPAFRTGVPGYVLGHQAGLEYGFSALGDLRLRAGDQGRLQEANSGNSTEAWMRVHGHELSFEGRRFEAHDVQMGALHFGTDIYTHETANGSAHLGVMASMGESRATFFDPERAVADLTTRTGDLEMDVKGAGLYWTLYSGRSYLDLTTQWLYYRNRYRDQLLAKSEQDGWGGTVSAEIGSAFAVGNTGWQIEPQLQLAYQRLELDEFADDVSSVSAVEGNGLRGRAALHIFRTPAQWLGMTDASPYVELGMQRDFKDAAAITVGSTSFREELPDTAGDAGVGFMGSVGSGLELHLDVRYQRSTEGEKDGVGANFGFRKTF